MAITTKGEQGIGGESQGDTKDKAAFYVIANPEDPQEFIYVKPEDYRDDLTFKDYQEQERNIKKIDAFTNDPELAEIRKKIKPLYDRYNERIEELKKQYNVKYATIETLQEFFNGNKKYQRLDRPY